MSTLQELIGTLRCGELARDVFEAVCRAENLSREELYNRLALVVARDFDNGTMSFDVADDAIFRIWSMMLEDCLRDHQFELRDPALAIYEAFDAGEYGRADGQDPVEKYTKPEIRRILEVASRGGTNRD